MLSLSRCFFGWLTNRPSSDRWQNGTNKSKSLDLVVLHGLLSLALCICSSMGVHLQMGGGRPPTLLSYAAFISGWVDRAISLSRPSFYHTSLWKPLAFRDPVHHQLSQIFLFARFDQASFNGFNGHFVPAVLLNSTFYQGSVVRLEAQLEELALFRFFDQFDCSLRSPSWSMVPISISAN